MTFSGTKFDIFEVMKKLYCLHFNEMTSTETYSVLTDKKKENGRGVPRCTQR